MEGAPVSLATSSKEATGQDADAEYASQLVTESNSPSKRPGWASFRTRCSLLQNEIKRLRSGELTELSKEATVAYLLKSSETLVAAADVLIRMNEKDTSLPSPPEGRERL
jgi:hypothetical protein